MEGPAAQGLRRLRLLSVVEAVTGEDGHDSADVVGSRQLHIGGEAVLDQLAPTRTRAQLVLEAMLDRPERRDRSACLRTGADLTQGGQHGPGPPQVLDRRPQLS